MKPIPETENSLVLRTGFSNLAAWEAICAAIRKPEGFFRFRANVEFLGDVEYAGITKDQLPGLLPKDYNYSFIFVVDQIAASFPDHPLLIADLYEGSGHEFRAVPS